MGSSQGAAAAGNMSGGPGNPQPGAVPALPPPASAAPELQAAAREGLQHSWHTAALTPHALFTQIRMWSGLVAGLAVCRQLSGCRDSGNGLLLRALPTAWPSSVLPIALWTPIPRAFTVSGSQKTGEHSPVRVRWQRSVKKWEGKGKPQSPSVNAGVGLWERMPKPGTLGQEVTAPPVTPPRMQQQCPDSFVLVGLLFSQSNSLMEPHTLAQGRLVWVCVITRFITLSSQAFPSALSTPSHWVSPSASLRPTVLYPTWVLLRPGHVPVPVAQLSVTLLLFQLKYHAGTKTPAPAPIPVSVISVSLILVSQHPYIPASLILASLCPCIPVSLHPCVLVLCIPVSLNSCIPASLCLCTRVLSSCIPASLLPCVLDLSLHPHDPASLCPQSLHLCIFVSLISHPCVPASLCPQSLHPYISVSLCPHDPKMGWLEMSAELLAALAPGCNTFCGLHIRSPGEMEKGQRALL